MAELALLHSAYGLRPAVLAAAQRLRAAGHLVHTPDYYEGRTADNASTGAAIAAEFGRPELIRRVSRAVAELPPETVLIGMSLGATLACEAARTRTPAALVLLHDSPRDPGELPGLPVALHAARPDEWIDESLFAAWAARPSAVAYRYENCSHLYTDLDADGGPADAAAAELTWQRVLDFLRAPYGS